MATDARTDARRLDPVAAAAALRRLMRQAQAPWLHGEIARRLGERLEPMRVEPARILDWWARLGGGAPTLRKRYPKAAIVPIEPDGIEREAAPSRRRWPWSGLLGEGTTPSLSDASGDAAIGRAQIVWANMVLPFIVDPPALFERWHRLLDVDGLVIFSCLGPATGSELRELYAGEGWPAPTPGFVDMHDLGDMLVAAGFADPVLDQETLTLRWPSADALLTELRQLGGNAAPDRHAGLRTPAWRRRLVAALSERAAADGTIGLSIEVAYGHGFKAKPRARAGEPVAVPLDDVRATLRQPRRPR